MSAKLLRTNQELRVENRNLRLLVLALLRRYAKHQRTVFLPHDLLFAAQRQLAIGQGREALTPTELQGYITQPEAAVSGALVVEAVAPAVPGQADARRHPAG
jgi:hypothetical protein